MVKNFTLSIMQRREIELPKDMDPEVSSSCADPEIDIEERAENSEPDISMNIADEDAGSSSEMLWNYSPDENIDLESIASNSSYKSSDSTCGKRPLPNNGPEENEIPTKRSFVQGNRAVSTSGDGNQSKDLYSCILVHREGSEMSSKAELKVSYDSDCNEEERQQIAEAITASLESMNAAEVSSSSADRTTNFDFWMNKLDDDDDSDGYCEELWNDLEDEEYMALMEKEYSKPVTENCQVSNKAEENEEMPTLKTFSQESSTSGERNHSNSTISMQLKFPDRTRVIMDMAWETEWKEIVSIVEAKGYDLEMFKMVAYYPKRILSNVPTNLKLRELNLFQRDTIHVKPL